MLRSRHFTAPTPDPFACGGCGAPVDLHGRVGAPVVCPCGIAHVIAGYAVVSDGDFPEPTGNRLTRDRQ